MDSRPTHVRFFSHIDVSDGHWIWTGALDEGGYGRFSWGKRTRKAHRAAWLIFRGSIPDGQQLHHTCYVRACVNPRHLELTTPKENSADRPAYKGQYWPRPRKAVCKHGHPMEGDNIAWVTRANGRVDRYCRECSRINNRAMAAKRKSQHG